MVLGKLPVPGRPTILITVGQGPIALAIGAGGGGLDIFTLIYPFFSFSLSLGDGPIWTEILSQRAVKPKTTNQPTNFRLVVGCFGVYRPFETVFQSISGRIPERGRKRREMIDERKISKQTPPVPTASAKGLSVLLFK